MRRPAALLLTTALATRALEPTQLWPTTQTCVSCRALGMGDYDGGAAIFVAPTTTSNTKVEALPVPVGADAAIAMEKALKGQEYGKVQTLTVAQGLVNRDGGVFDNLPYATTGRSKFAKKDLYDRIKGKDWPGRSLKPQNVFASLKERFGKKAKVRVEDQERGEDKAPYRGAYGFPPVYEDAQARIFAGYVSPYSLFLEAIGDMLDCDVTSALLEDACPLDDRTDLAGALRLQPRNGSAALIVECFADEAVGLALAAGVDVLTERSLLEVFSRTARFGLERRTSVAPLKMRLQVVDDLEPSIAQEVVADAPETIKSADEYEALGTQGKLRVLVKAEEFKRRRGKLPRPRVINAAGCDEPVDELLIPLLDEAVRRDLAVEAALKRGDIAGAAALMAGKSKRHAARDRAAQASADGDLAGEIRARDDESVYTAIRADITQDEGSYSRFLDKDEWYERQRRRTTGAYDPADDPLLNPPWKSNS